MGGGIGADTHPNGGDQFAGGNGMVNNVNPNMVNNVSPNMPYTQAMMQQSMSTRYPMERVSLHYI